MRISWAATLTVALADEFHHLEENLVQPHFDYTSYYRDETSGYRIPWWMIEDRQDLLNDDQLQIDGAWNMKNSIIDLGNGHLKNDVRPSFGNLEKQREFNGADWEQMGTSSQSHVDFIASVRSYYEEGPGGENPRVNRGIANNPNPNNNNQKVWDHIRNFWYRDGDLFALIADDNACDMMREGDGQDDVSLDFKDEKKEVHVNIEKEQHHLEHLRDFCNRMGGALYAPTSQEEYDDLFERDQGICANHMPVWENGMALANWKGKPEEARNNRIELYLNLHRDGYLECPGDDFVMTARNSGGDEEEKVDNLAQWTVQPLKDGRCPDRYEADSRQRDLIRDNYRQYYTTDPLFGNVIGDTCPLAQREGPWLYSVFETIRGKNSKDSDPYIPDDWWTGFSLANMRFQKFVQNDVAVINTPLAVSDGNQMRQKDCVTVQCGVGYQTGPADDRRYATEWNVDYCNQQRHVGICRVPVVGCNKPTYRCADGYTNSCADRSVYVEEFTAWLNNDVAEQVIRVLVDFQFNEVTDDDGVVVEFVERYTDEELQHLLKPTRLDPNSPPDVQMRNVVCTNGEDPADVRAFMEERVNAAGIEVDYINCRDGEDMIMRPNDQCTCKCSFDTYEKFLTTNKIGEERITDLLDQSYGFISQESTCAVNKEELGCNHNWQCNAPNFNDCLTGGAKAKCAMDDSGRYAKWQWDGKKAPKKLCKRHCCDTYDDSIHTKASLSSELQIDYKAGDRYTVQCDPGQHVLGEDDDVTSMTFRIKKKDLFDQCYKPVECGPLACKTCPEMENGYCHFAQEPFREIWQNGETLRCRCNKCFGMVDAPMNLPFEDAVCEAPGWIQQGQCVQVQCANAPNLMFEGRLAGIPDDQKANCGETITYSCAPGFVAENGEAPTAECNDQLPTADEGDFGPQGFYGAIKGRCVPDTGCKMPPQSEDKAWDPVFFANRGDFAGQCHDEATYQLGNELNAGVDVYPEGSYAVYECFDDFHAIKKFGFRQFMKNAMLEIDCASGNKGPDDECRTDQTGVRFDAGIALHTNNDKLVARCVNGEWQVPSHKCVCEDDKHPPKRSSIFDGQCEARSHSHDFHPSQAPPMSQESGCPRLVYTILGFIPAVFLN